MLPPLLLNLGCFALLEWFKTEKVQITVTKNAWSTISTNYSMMFGILSESHIFPIILRIRITLENSNKFNMVTLAFSKDFQPPAVFLPKVSPGSHSLSYVFPLINPILSTAQSVRLDHPPQTENEEAWDAEASCSTGRWMKRFTLLFVCYVLWEIANLWYSYPNICQVFYRKLVFPFSLKYSLLELNKFVNLFPDV